MLFLALDYRQKTSEGMVSVACSSFISRLMDQFFFWAERPALIATFALCSKKDVFRRSRGRSP